MRGQLCGHLVWSRPLPRSAQWRNQLPRALHIQRRSPLWISRARRGSHSETSSSLKKLLSLNFWNHSQLHRRMGLLLRLACLQTWSQPYHRGELHVDRGQELRRGPVEDEEDVAVGAVGWR